MASITPSFSDEFYSELGYEGAKGFYRKGDEDKPPLVEKTVEKIPVEAVYGIESESGAYTPLAYFKSYPKKSPKELRDLLDKVWNEGRVPIVVVFLPDSIRVYNTTIEPPKDEDELDKSDRLLQRLEIADQALTEMPEIEKYSREKIESGDFWSQRKDEITDKGKVDQHLYRNLEGLREKLNQDLGLEKSAINSLIIKSIFVLYLEDRGIITESFYEESGFEGEEYRELLPDKRDTYRLFDRIKEEFNGDVFGSSQEREKISQEHLEQLKRFLNGFNFETKQTRFFPYSFDLIPIELISSIYEKFVPQGKGNDVHYTPQNVARFMVDQISSSHFEENSKIIDPACGSGVFIVNAFDRILKNRLRNTENSNSEEIINLLKNNIYGVDKNSEAIKITAFSLYLKVLEHLDTDQIDEFSLPGLVGENLFEKDFFDDEAAFNETRFDVVLGNPPWGNARRMRNESALKYCDENNFSYSNNQVAQCFMWKARQLSRSDSETCFLVPTKSILMDKSSEDFRADFWTGVGIERVMNLSILRDELFENSDHPCSIIKYNFSMDDDDLIEYVTPKYQSAGIIQSIIVDNTEVRYIEPNDFGRLTATVAMHGGVRDIQFIQKLNKFESLREVCRNYEFDHREGLRNGGENDKRRDELKELPHIDTRKFQSYGLEEEDFVEMDTPYFDRPRPQWVYKGPKVLVKEGISLSDDQRIKSTYLNQDVTFKESIFAITSERDLKQSEKEILKVMALILNSKLAEYYLFMTSSRWGVERDAPLKTEILDVPCKIPEPGSDDLRNLAELYDKLADAKIKGESERLTELKREVDQRLFDVYDLDEEEIGIVEDRLEFTLDFFLNQWESKAAEDTDSEHLEAYANVIVRRLNRFLEKSEFQASAKIYIGDDEEKNLRNYTEGVNSISQSPLSLITISLDESSQIDEIETESKFKERIEKISNTVYKKEKESLFFLKKKIDVSGDSINIIKPNEVRFWTRAEALNDVNEIIGEIIE